MEKEDVEAILRRQLEELKHGATLLGYKELACDEAVVVHLLDEWAPGSAGRCGVQHPAHPDRGADSPGRRQGELREAPDVPAIAAQPAVDGQPAVEASRVPGHPKVERITSSWAGRRSRRGRYRRSRDLRHARSWATP